MPISRLRNARELVVEELRQLRRERRVSQVELARRLGKPQQFVSAVEQGDRRIDVVECLMIAHALGADPVAVFARIAERITVELNQSDDGGAGLD